MAPALPRDPATPSIARTAGDVADAREATSSAHARNFATADSTILTADDTIHTADEY